MEEQPETFKDVARICVKKKNKGPFDELITSLYRVKQLTEFIPLIDPKWDEKTTLVKCISKGLNYPNFSSFKDEVVIFESFGDLAECASMKDFYQILVTEPTEEAIYKKLLRRFHGVLHDHEFALQFLKNWVTREVEVLERQVAHLQANQV
jgi:hypothetical protein